MERMGAEKADLAGLRVLVVEDEFLVAVAIERALAAAGCEVVGPVGRLSEAAQAARLGDLDGAILDVHLHGETVSPVAERLTRDGVPVLFATAASDRELPAELRKLPRLGKPVEVGRLVAAAARLFKAPRAHPA
jgi:DNA-binding response OmpR family regulator